MRVLRSYFQYVFYGQRLSDREVLETLSVYHCHVAALLLMDYDDSCIPVNDGKRSEMECFQVNRIASFVNKVHFSLDDFPVSFLKRMVLENVVTLTFDRTLLI